MEREKIPIAKFYTGNHKNTFWFISNIIVAEIRKMVLPVRTFWIAVFIPLLILSGCNKRNESLTITFAGDLMLDRGTRKVIEAKGPDFLFENLNNITTSSDYFVANLECVVCDSKLIPINKKYTFRSNREWLLSLYNHNITHLTLANNHSLDFGKEGINQTITNLNRIGIKPIGYCKNSNTTCQPVLIEKNGNNMAIFSSCFLKQSYSNFSFDNASVLSEKIKIFKGLHPKTIIIVCLHWGIEKELKPTSIQVKEAHLLINSGADMIIGHHPHVVQSIETYHGKYIFYSIGNFIFDNTLSQAILTNLTLTKGRIDKIKIIPIKIEKSKPQLMNTSESESFRKQIQSLSSTMELKQEDGSWEIL